MILPGALNPKWKSENIYHFDIDPWLWVGITQTRHQKIKYEVDRIPQLLG